MDAAEGDRVDAPYPPYLRLEWSRPETPRRPTAPQPLGGRPAQAAPGTNLALAIESHLAGADGLSDDDFLQSYSGRKAR
jgi:hypothetical protein